MNNPTRKTSGPKKPTATGKTGSRGFTMLEPKGPNAKNPAWANATIVQTASSVVDAPPAGAGIDWLWVELPPLREWVVKNAAELGMPVDADRLIRQVVEAVEAQRPDLGTVPPREYLHALVEKLVLMPGA